VKARKVKPGKGYQSEPSRRELLRAAAAAVAVWTGAPLRHGVVEACPRQPVSRPPATSPWWLGKYRPCSRVVQVRSPGVLGDAAVNPSVLSDMLSAGVQVLTGRDSTGDGWRSVLGNAERIVIKFNRVGGGVLATTDALARELVGALEKSGYTRDRIALVEAPPQLARELGTREPAGGWGSSIIVGGRPEELAAYLLEADALINVPFLKTHRVAGMSGALKNLSHAVIRHPGRYHDGGCAPYVGEVIGQEEVSSRIRLTIVDALRLMVRNGPESSTRDVIGHCELLFGFDPVAIDSVGLQTLLHKRLELGIEDRIAVPYLDAAGAAGVGRREAHLIDRVVVAMDS